MLRIGICRIHTVCQLVMNVYLYDVLLLFRLQVYPLHSTVTLEEQNGVFLCPVPGYRKVKNIYFILCHVLSVPAVLMISSS